MQFASIHDTTNSKDIKKTPTFHATDILTYTVVNLPMVTNVVKCNREGQVCDKAGEYSWKVFYF